ncbi:phosphate ABC transporter permease subunit PstC, partial [Bacillus mycoides]|nr:phosphate ABC transporter permease subunit PstC [Bacillus mycoides]
GKKQSNYVKSEYIGRSLVTFCGIFIVFITLAIIAFSCGKGILSFKQSGISLSEVLTATNWNPNAGQGTCGAVIFIVGSTLVSFG